MAIKIVLAKIMVDKQIKSKDLDRAIGITEQNLSILKNGKAKAIIFSTLEAICKYLECQPGDILVYKR
ncbi:helix-turn-helix domain-containing protein [Francisella tularensis]|uniref:helix-turn-helix domain-containing protein n=1 Tax=Francisella tularensis TaxID=263 RepID=UPI002381C9AD|nr:helix-turn-helix transcriptional regulator [Francisella tularensis]MDE4992358.1 helix-turn-helix transcriptional regulator [Francisella tularensis subsp. holarctica]